VLGGAVNKLTYQTPVEDPGMEPGSTGQTGLTPVKWSFEIEQGKQD